MKTKDLIIEQVRKNRADLLDKFNGNLDEFVDYLKGRKDVNEKLGFRYTIRSPKKFNKKVAA